jgi:hypothetical protein
MGSPDEPNVPLAMLFPRWPLFGSPCVWQTRALSRPSAGDPGRAVHHGVSILPGIAWGPSCLAPRAVQQASPRGDSPMGQEPGSLGAAFIESAQNAVFIEWPSGCPAAATPGPRP